MAPEMINNIGYDAKVDIWGLGIILYEMTHGHTPFNGKNEE
jgi:serine/threonine protein kinase